MSILMNTLMSALMNTLITQNACTALAIYMHDYTHECIHEQRVYSKSMRIIFPQKFEHDSVLRALLIYIEKQIYWL